MFVFDNRCKKNQLLCLVILSVYLLFQSVNATASTTEENDSFRDTVKQIVAPGKK
jgi:hypothetical protein